MDSNIETNIEYCMSGDDEYLLYKKINGYHIYITDFTFMHNSKSYFVHVDDLGSDGNWFVFSINNKIIASNNVWINHYKNKKDFVLKEDLPDKPMDSDIIYPDFNLLPQDKKNKLIKYVLDNIDLENRLMQSNKKIMDEFYGKYELICNIFMDSDECVYCVLKNINTDVYNFYCVNDMDDIFDAQIFFTTSDIISVYDFMMNRCTNNTPKFYDCTVYGDLNYKILTGRIKRIDKHQIIQKECEFHHKTPIHHFVISKLR